MPLGLLAIGSIQTAGSGHQCTCLALDPTLITRFCTDGNTVVRGVFSAAEVAHFRTLSLARSGGRAASGPMIDRPNPAAQRRGAGDGVVDEGFCAQG